MMDMFFLAEGAAGAGGGMDPQFMQQMQLMLMLVLGLVAYWLLFLRPHNKKRKEMQDKLSKLSKGDEVVTIGGIHGKVANIKDNLIVVRVDDKTEITFDKTAISTVKEQKNPHKKEAVVEADDKTKTKAESEDEKK